MGYAVYRLTNTRNGQVYIGSTGQHPNRRFTCHAATAKFGISKAPIHEAIRRFGRDAFTLDVVADNIPSQEQAVGVEMALIRTLNAVYAAGIYNVQGVTAQGGL